jgi:hypothetical protein
MNETLRTWHRAVKEKDSGALDDLLADDVVFHSPVVHTPQRGKALTKLYLSAAFMLLANDTFAYVREVIGEYDAMLEFTVEVQGVHINGIDMIRWNADGQIVDFKVMLRPLKAINLMHGLMQQMFDQLSNKKEVSEPKP